MNKEDNDSKDRLVLKIPCIKAESETQTIGHLITLSPEKQIKMESTSNEQNMSIRKRRNLSKNRSQAMRHREKTPEPGRTPIPHEDTTSDDDEFKSQRSSREIEADNTYEEMKRLVQQKAGVKDPVYDMDTDEVLEARAFAANERRRRSISPFAIPDKEELCKLERKGSFIDPTNKLLSTTYNLSPKEEDKGRRSSLTIETSNERRNSLSPGTPTSSSPREKCDFQYPILTTPKRLEEVIYPDEIKSCDDKQQSKPITPGKKDAVFTFDEKENQPKLRKASTPKPPEQTGTGNNDIVTKVIQVERTPSKKVSQENKPCVEIRQRVVRTPSRKLLAEAKPVVTKNKQVMDESISKVPPVKPARTQSATRFGGKTSESEMSEDQGNLFTNAIASPRRRVVPTPRRFLKGKSQKDHRSHSVNRIEDVRVEDKTGTGMSQTSKEIIELLQQARARSLSVPKEDQRLPPEYQNYSKTLMTPNKTPSTPRRNTRGISCPKTIQIISDREILGGISLNKKENLDKTSRQSSGYIDASQSEYTSSCYSSSPSDNECNFNLSEKTTELTQKLHLLSQEAYKREDLGNIILSKDESKISKAVQRKKVQKVNLKETKDREKKSHKVDTIKSDENSSKVKSASRFKLISNWRQFQMERKFQYEGILLQMKRCICDLILMIILCGLGGLMFKTLEGSFENAYKCGTKNVKRDFIEALWRGSHYMREDDWKSMARKKLYEFEDQLHTAHEAGVTSYSGLHSWNFMNSFVYCLTLITTIGYGHIAPKTTYGRAATIVYAIIGIPLFLIVLADFGKLFTRIIKYFWDFIRRFYYTRSCRKVRRTVPVQGVMKGFNIVYDVVRRPSQIFSEEDMAAASSRPTDCSPPALHRKTSDVPPPLPPKPSTVSEYPDAETEPDTPAPSVFEIDDEFNLPISVATFILIVYIIIGAVVYNIWEQWGFFNSFYFVFISMSTIGLGDLVPNHPIFMMASILYLVFGLALTSMCINVVQEKLSDTFKKASAKIGATIGLKLAEEDGSLVPMTPAPTEVVPVHMSTSDKGDTERDETTQGQIDKS